MVFGRVRLPAHALGFGLVAFVIDSGCWISRPVPIKRKGRDMGTNYYAEWYPSGSRVGDGPAEVIGASFGIRLHICKSHISFQGKVFNSWSAWRNFLASSWVFARPDPLAVGETPFWFRAVMTVGQLALAAGLAYYLLVRPWVRTPPIDDLATRAGELGARLQPFTPVHALLCDGARATGVVTTRGEIHAPVVVDAAGGWTARVATSVGVALPLVPVRHQLFVTEPIAGVEPLQPIVRLVEASVYVRYEQGGLLFGGQLEGAEVCRHGAGLYTMEIGGVNRSPCAVMPGNHPPLDRVAGPPLCVGCRLWLC